MAHKLPPYVPSSTDLGWANMVTRVTRDGGVVGTSRGAYRVDRTNKTFTLTDPARLDTDFDTFVVHHRHHYVFKAIGWTVHPIIDWDNMIVPDKKDAENN